MRKFTLSAVVVLFFVFYAIYYQAQNSGNQNINQPITINNLPDQSSIPTTSPTVLPIPSGEPPTNTPAPVKTSRPTQTPSGLYRDGVYTGPSTDAFYGNVQVQATVQGGKIVDVQFLDYPHDRNTSREINSQAMPILRSEAIAAQSGQVDIVSGATDTSLAFIQSLSSALSPARN